MKRITILAALWLAAASGAVFAATASPLVDIDWAKQNSCKAGVVVLDIRNELDGHSKLDYLRGHIPCAVYSDYMKDGWRAKVNNIPGMLPPVPQIEKLIGSLGIDGNTHVVIYSAGTNALDMGSATRVYWTLKVLGHDEVSILDGGYNAYAADKANKIETGMNTPKPKAFVAHFRKDMYPAEADVEKAAKGGVVLIDNRPSDQYLGVNRTAATVKRNGTIPGAKNLPESWLTDNNGGKFRSAAMLVKLYKDVGIPLKGEEINFCNTGHWASLGWFVSSELLGNKQAKVYDGSMAEWSADPKAAMEQKIKFE
ncbi:MAG: sulfurtransferase [Sulfuricellaceae bacterium]|nr:sulfurtransferase [Sulfuricellaceae bacterium]